MPIEDRVRMITEAYGEEFATPVKICIRQEGSIKLMTKEQLLKRLWQFSAEERKEIIHEAFGKVPKEWRTGGSPVQIHMLQIPKKQKPPMTPMRALKAKRLASARIKLEHYSLEEQRKIVLKAFGKKEQPARTSTSRKPLPSTKPVVMGNLSVIKESPTNHRKQTNTTIARIRATNIANPTREKWIANWAKWIEGREVDEELSRKAANSTKIPWDHQAAHKQQSKLKRAAKKDPASGLQTLKTYKLEHQEVARKEGWLPPNSGVTFKPSDPLENQEANALYIPMHVRTKLGTHVLPALVDTGATQNFLSEDTAKKLGLTWKEDDTPKPVANADGSKCGSGIITQYCDIPMKLDNLWKEEQFYKTETGTDQVVLGIPWLANFKPTINWTKGTVTEVLEVPLHVPTRKVKKKLSWSDESLEPATCSVKEEELNSQINGDQEKRDTPWSGEHCPSPGIRPGGDQSKQPNDALGDKNTPSDLTALQTTLEVKKAQCSDLLERDLIQDYLEDLLCLTNKQPSPETTQEIEPEHAQDSSGKVDKQKPQTQTKEPIAINDQLCEARGIEEIPWQQSKAKQVPLPLEVPETYQEAARWLGLFKPTVAKVAEPKERYKKGIQVPTKGTSNASTQPESQPKPLSGLEYLEDLEAEDPITETERMIVENHGLKRGQEAQSNMTRLNQSSNRPVQRGVKHGLSDPYAQENEHLEQEEVQEPEHMVVEDHGPKKGMTPQLKPQINPLFFPFATCLPTFSMPRDHDLKEGRNITRKAYFQNTLMGRESNDNQDKQELSHQESSTVNAITTSPWPDQWQLEGLSNDITDLEDPWPDLEETKTWNDTEEIDLTDNAPYATPWGLVGEPRWITELDNATEPEPEEDPFPLTLHYPDKDNEPKLGEELSPQTANDIPDLKGTLFLQNDQRDQETSDPWNTESESQGSTSDDEEGTTKTSHYLTLQKPIRPTSDDKKGATAIELPRQNTETLPQSKNVSVIKDAAQGDSPHCMYKSISHPDMTQPWMTRPQDTKADQNNADQPKWENSMMPLLQTSAHYPEMSKQNNRSLGTRSFGTLSTSSIQEHADSAKTLLSAMTQGTDVDQSSTPPSNDQGSKKHATPQFNKARTNQSQTPSNPDQKRTALTTLGIIITAILTIVQGNRRRHEMIDQTTDRTIQVPHVAEQTQRMTQNAEYPRYGHGTQEEPQYKSSPRNATSSPSKLPVPFVTPSAPNNTPITLPCLLPSPTPLLQLRFEDSGSKEKSTTILGKATTSSIHGGATMTAAIPGTVARRWTATKIMLRTKTSTATLGTPVQQWGATKVASPVIPMTSPIPPITMQIPKNAPGIASPHLGTSLIDKSTQNSITSSPISSANTSQITPQSECWDNVNLPMTSRASASTFAWTAQHNGSPEKSKPSTLTTQTWRNYSTTWNGTYVPKPSLTHSMKAAASKSPIPLSMNKGPKSSGPCLENGSAEANNTDWQQQPSTYASGRKPLLSICSYSKTTGLPPRPFTTCSGDNTSPNPSTPSGGRYSDKTTLYTTKSLTSRDTRIPRKGSTLDTWKHPPKQGMNVASGHHFSILSLSLTPHHLTDYLTYHLTRAPDLVPCDWGAHDYSHDPVTDDLILTIDFSRDQTCDLSHDTM